jgi:hypothetical protein
MPTKYSKGTLNTATLSAIVGISLFCTSCFDSEPEKPGSLTNPKLVELINQQVENQLRAIDPKKLAAFRSDARINVEIWLSSIDEAIARCRHGPGDDTKSNMLVLDIETKTGISIKELYTGQRCFYQLSKPLVMRVKFEKGRAIDAKTDGRELKSSVSVVKGEIAEFAHILVRADFSRNRGQYFIPEKSEREIAEEWKLKAP